MEPGLYITFFSSDEPPDRELPPVGPLYNVVLRHKTLVAERRMVMQAQELGVAIDRWLEAELEMQRATGEEPGGTKRSEKRVSARDGVFIRFAIFGENNEGPIAPELGPYASVVVTPRSVEADGAMIAARAASELAPWELTRGAGDALDGVHKPDIAFRSANTSYHPSITPEPPRERPGTTAKVDAPAVPTPAPAALPPLEPAFTLPPRTDDAFTPPGPEPFFIPPPRTEQVFTPRPRTEQIFKPSPRTEQILDRAAPGAEAVPPAEHPQQTKQPSQTEEPEQRETVFVERPKKQTEIYSARVVAQEQKGQKEQKDTSLTPGDIELIARIDRQRSDETLRARIHEGERQRLGIGERATSERDPEAASSLALRYRPQADTSTGAEELDGEGREWGPALWRMRFAIIGVLLLLAGVYGFIVIRTGGAPLSLGQPEGTRVIPVGQRFTAPGWEFVADGVTRVEVAGNVHARGIFVVVRLTAVNRANVPAQLGLASFTLVDVRGARYTPESLSTATYQGGPTAGTTYPWDAELQSGRTLAMTLLFDLDPSLTRGMVLQLTAAPNVQLKLD